MATDDPYADLKQHRLTPEKLARLAVAAPRRRQEESRHFVKMPVLWVERLAEARHIASYRIALHLLYQTWKTGRQSVELPNASLATLGISRRSKWRALGELERLGLVMVERRRRRTPRIVVQS
jgi:hypothetical protein